MFSLSLPAANEIFGLANSALILGAVLVLAGTVGTIWTSAIRERYADERISNNEKQTAAANENAANANERTAELTAQATALELDLERERNERLRIQERLEATQAEATHANERALAASRKATSVDIRTVDRHLTPEQRRILVDAIKPFAGTKIEVAIQMGDKESLALAAELVSVLRDAGWDPGGASGINQAIYSGNPSYGIQLTINENDARSGHLPRGFEALARILMSLGLTKEPFMNPGVASGKIELRVMPKQPTP